VVIYHVVALFCFLKNGHFIDVVLCCFFVYYSYPLIFVGTRDGILDLFKVKERNTGLLNKVTIGLMAVVTLMASKLTDLGFVASVGGATFGTALVFVYPTIMFLRLAKKNGKLRGGESKLAGLIAITGVVMGAIGTTMALGGVDI
jgi:hypothetical protein